MTLHEKVQAVATELKRLKTQGVETLAISDATLNGLREAFAPSEKIATAAPPTVFVSPPQKEVGATAPTKSPEREPVENPFMPRAKSETSAVKTPVAAAAELPPAPVVELPRGSKQQQWDWLKERVLNDPVCKARVRPGKKVVLGVGSLDAPIFFCGEAPGGEEEVQGEPFVGPAGQLLTKMIKAMGIERSDVYIGNIMNWRPDLPTAPGLDQVGNRPPTPEEMTYCTPFLKAQIAIVQPKLIVALGSTAASGLLGRDSFKTLGEIRGQWRTFADVPVMVTYHPSYLLRYSTQKTKRLAWEDFMQVMERAGLPISEKQRGYFL